MKYFVRILLALLFVTISGIIYHTLMNKMSAPESNKSPVPMETFNLSNSNNSQELTFDPNTWIFNNKVAQYGTKLILTIEGKMIIESLGFFDYSSQNNAHLRQSLTCLLKINYLLYKLKIYEAHSMQTWIRVDTGRSLWRVRCEVPSELTAQADLFQVAISDAAEYETLNGRTQSPLNYLTFHRPNRFDATRAKKKSFGHCVHMMYDVEGPTLNKLFDWIEIQSKIGVDRFRFYTFRVSDDSVLKIREKYSDSVEIIPYSLSRDVLCSFDGNLDPQVADYLYENCLKLFSIYFDNSRNGVFNAHEKVCTNDCLLRFKYDYEFTTNYDFDELIFPRKLATNDYDAFADSNATSVNFNLYEYALRLKQKFGQNIAVFRFEHVLFMHNDHERFLDQLFGLENGKTSSVSYDYMNRNKFVHFNVDDASFRSINTLKRVQPYVKRLNESITSQAQVSPVWNSIYAIYMKQRLGKSIYDTNLTEIYNQHNADVLAPNSKNLNVPTEDGFASHFRNNIDGFFADQTYSFEGGFYFDIEYYEFLAQFKKKT